MAYSDNLLLNSSGDFGTLNWTVQNVDTTAGGSTGNFSFRMQPTASMQQTITFETSPPDIQFDADYWLEPVTGTPSANARTQIVLKLAFDDDTFDTYIYPCIGTASDWHAVRETITFGTRDEDKKLTAATVIVTTVEAGANVLIDGLAVRQDESATPPVNTGKYDDFWDNAVSYGLDKDKPLLGG